MFGWVPDAAPGLALSLLCVGWAGALSPGMFGWVSNAAPGLALSHCLTGWAGALSLFGTYSVG